MSVHERTFTLFSATSVLLASDDMGLPSSSEGLIFGRLLRRIIALPGLYIGYLVKEEVPRQAARARCSCGVRGIVYTLHQTLYAGPRRLQPSNVVYSSFSKSIFLNSRACR